MTSLILALAMSAPAPLPKPAAPAGATATVAPLSGLWVVPDWGGDDWLIYLCPTEKCYGYWDGFYWVGTWRLKGKVLVVNDRSSSEVPIEYDVPLIDLRPYWK